MKFPEIIILGAPKCGTTALWYNLDKHPDITMATKSTTSIEMNFWRSRGWKHGISWYKKKFDNSTLLAGEKSTIYYTQKKSIKEIKKYIPDCKLILCTRNPVDRAYSHWQMNYNAGKVHDFTYELFLSRYSKEGKYFFHLEKNVLSVFDKNQLYICVAERMKKRPTVEMNKLFDFLEVSNLDYPKKIINGQLLKNRSRQDDIKLNRKEKFYRVWSKHKKTLTGPLRKQILEYYRQFNKKFFKHLGYEIKEWYH